MKASQIKATPSDSQNLTLASWIWMEPSETTELSNSISALQPHRKPAFDVFSPLRRGLDRLEVQNPKLARSLCRLIPAQCPFERDIELFGRTVLHIPPLCKLNPLYEEVVALRFRALCYLADVCGEDVTRFC